jgi:hypothetical protein
MRGLARLDLRNVVILSIDAAADMSKLDFLEQSFE